MQLEFQIRPVNMARLLYRTCVAEFPDWNDHLRENAGAMDLAREKWDGLEAAAAWNWSDTRICKEAVCPVKLATAAAYLASEMGIHTLLPGRVTGNRTQPHYRLLVERIQLTFPEEKYLEKGALNEGFFVIYGELSRRGTIPVRLLGCCRVLHPLLPPPQE